MREIALATLENVAKDDLEEDMPDDVKMVRAIPFRHTLAIQNIGLHCRNYYSLENCQCSFWHIFVKNYTVYNIAAVEEQ